MQSYDKVRPTPKDSNGENLHTYLKKTRLVPWRHFDDKNFWVGLQLSLPPAAAAPRFRAAKSLATPDRLTTQTSIELPLSRNEAADNGNAEDCVKNSIV